MRNTLKLNIAISFFIISPFLLSQTLNGPTSFDVIGNPFSQPNITLQLGKKPLEWYGSGDVNLDNKIDSADVTAINNGTKNWMSDVDGDGVTDSKDSQVILDYLGGKIPYLPGHWNELTTRSEREDWAKKMIVITDEPSQNLNYAWVCATGVLDICFKNGGLSNMDAFIQQEKDGGMQHPHSSEHNARTNLPFYYFSTTNTSGVSHACTGILVGEDPLNFNDWMFFSYHSFTPLKAGDFDMDANHPVTMGLEAYFQNQLTKQNEFNSVSNMINWELTKGIPSEGISNKPYITLNNPNIIKVHIAALPDLTVDGSKIPANQNLTPDFLKSLSYNSVPDTTKENTSLAIHLDYTDSDTAWLTQGTTFYFTRKFVAWIYSGGITKSDSTVQKIGVENLTSVEDSQNIIPKKFLVYQNFPNPFNPSTIIKYELPKEATVTIKLFDLLGREIKTLVNEEKTAGSYSFNFNASDLAGGVYFYRIVAGSYSQTKKMVLLK